MTDIPESRVLNDVVEVIHDHKDLYNFERSTYNARNKSVDKYVNQKTLLSQEIKKKIKNESLIKKRTKQMIEITNSLEDVVKANEIECYKIQSALKNEETENNKLIDYLQNNLDKHKKKWEDIKKNYESTPLFSNLNKIKNDIALLELKIQISNAQHNSLKSSVEKYDMFNKIRFQYMIVNFAQAKVEFDQNMKNVMCFNNDINKLKRENESIENEKKIVLLTVQEMQEQLGKRPLVEMVLGNEMDSKVNVELEYLPTVKFEKQNLPVLQIPKSQTKNQLNSHQPLESHLISDHSIIGHNTFNPNSNASKLNDSENIYRKSSENNIVSDLKPNFEGNYNYVTAVMNNRNENLQHKVETKNSMDYSNTYKVSEISDYSVKNHNIEHSNITVSNCINGGKTYHEEPLQNLCSVTVCNKKPKPAEKEHFSVTSEKTLQYNEKGKVQEVESSENEKVAEECGNPPKISILSNIEISNEDTIKILYGHKYSFPSEHSNNQKMDFETSDNERQINLNNNQCSTYQNEGKLNKRKIKHFDDDDMVSKEEAVKKKTCIDNFQFTHPKILLEYNQATTEYHQTKPNVEHEPIKSRYFSSYVQKTTSENADFSKLASYDSTQNTLDNSYFNIESQSLKISPEKESPMPIDKSVTLKSSTPNAVPLTTQNIKSPDANYFMDSSIINYNGRKIDSETLSTCLKHHSSDDTQESEDILPNYTELMNMGKAYEISPPDNSEIDHKNTNTAVQNEECLKTGGSNSTGYFSFCKNNKSDKKEESVEKNSTETTPIFNFNFNRSEKKSKGFFFTNY